MRHNSSKAAKLARREEAEARNRAWNELTPWQQLESLSKRRGLSGRQVALISRKIGV